MKKILMGLLLTFTLAVGLTQGVSAADGDYPQDVNDVELAESETDINMEDTYIESEDESTDDTVDELTDELIETINELETFTFSQETLASIGFASNFSELESLLTNYNYTIIVLMNDIQMDYALTIDHNVAMLAVSPITVSSAKYHFYIQGQTDITVEMLNITLDGCGTGGGISLSSKNTISLTGATMQNCKNTQGGGIYVYGDGTFYLTDINIKNCKATSGSGIYVYGKGSCNITNISIQDCNANGGSIYIRGNGVYDISGISIQNCKATSGGGIYIYGNGSYNIADMSVQNCTVNSGGGICVYGDGTFYLTNISIQDCKATTGGGINIYGNGSYNFTDISIQNCKATGGGGIYMNGNGNYDLTNISIQDGSATTGGGIKIYGKGVYNFKELILQDCNATSAGGIYVNGRASLQFSETTIKNCSAIHDGGGIEVTGKASLKFSETTIENCSAKYGGGIYTSAFLEFQSGHILGNSATYNGGGIYISNLNNLYVGEDVVFSGNTAKTYYYLSDEDGIALHTNNIKTTSFSEPFTEYAYNNYDIAYTDISEYVDMSTVNFYLNDQDPEPYYSVTVITGEPIGELIEDLMGSIEGREEMTGYIIIGWHDDNYISVDSETVITDDSNFYADLVYDEHWIDN